MIHDYINYHELLLTCTQNMRGITYNLIFSKTIYLAPVARLVCQNVSAGNTRCTDRDHTYTQLFPVSKTDGFQKFEHARPKTMSKNARPFSPHSRTQFMLHHRSLY